MPHPIHPVLLTLALAGCQSYRAHRTESFEVDAPETLHTLTANTHNGDIRVDGLPAADRIRVVAHLTAWGSSPEDAQRRLDDLQVLREVRAGTLDLGLFTSHSGGWGGGDVAFEIEAPARLALRLASHNGDLAVAGMTASVKANSHNGDVQVSGAIPELEIGTHNGGIRARIDGEGSLQGGIASHNGSVHLSLAPGRACTVEAATHNGGISVRPPFHVLSKRPGSVSAATDARGGSVHITTHNGSVRLGGGGAVVR